MSYSTSMNTITVNGLTYEVEESYKGHADYASLTLERDGKPVFEGLEGRLGHETDPGESPRDWSNVGTMVVAYDGYELGDEHPRELDFESECPACDGTGELTVYRLDSEQPIEDNDEMVELYGMDAINIPFTIRLPDCAWCNGNGSVELNPIEYFKKERGARVVLPLCVYEHSGITMFIGKVGEMPFDASRWDTSFVGFIFDTPEKVKECMGDDATDEQIKAALEQEVKTYAAYLEGDVTWYSVDDTETNFSEGCGGYVGDSDHCKNECFQSMEDAIEQRLAEMVERAEWAARDVVTV